MQEESVLQASLEVYHAMAQAVSPTEMAQVLLLLEKLLGRGGLLRAAWAHHWQASWQRAASYCVDWKHALLLTAALQVWPAAPPLDWTSHSPFEAYVVQASLLPSASLPGMQAQLRRDLNALSRPAFSRMAHDERCQLYFPHHNDQVHSLR
jgi:hypothetical protein